MCLVVMDYVAAAVVGYCGITRRVAPREENGKFVVFGLHCPSVSLAESVRLSPDVRLRVHADADCD